MIAAIELSPKQRQALKARAHGLKPVVLLGAAGLTAATMKEIDRALLAHELIKVRVPGDDRDERDRIFSEVAAELGAAKVQAIGKLLVLFRPSPEPEAAPAEPLRRATRPVRRSPGPKTTPRRPGRAR